jgi:hypothetical protein
LLLRELRKGSFEGDFLQGNEEPQSKKERRSIAEKSPIFGALAAYDPRVRINTET